jgi:predicted nucleotidyltransferase
MSPEIKRLLVELRKGLSSLYGERLRAVILFGSYARGDYDEGSDLDVLVVLDDYHSYWEELVRSAKLASDLSLKYGVTISRTIMTEEKWKMGDLPLLRNVRREGIPA